MVRSRDDMEAQARNEEEGGQPVPVMSALGASRPRPRTAPMKRAANRKKPLLPPANGAKAKDDLSMASGSLPTRDLVWVSKEDGEVRCSSVVGRGYSRGKPPTCRAMPCRHTLVVSLPLCSSSRLPCLSHHSCWFVPTT